MNIRNGFRQAHKSIINKDMFIICVFTLPKGTAFELEPKNKKEKLVNKVIKVTKINQDLFKDKDLYKFSVGVFARENDKRMIYSSFLIDFIKDYAGNDSWFYPDFIKEFGYRVKGKELVKNV